MRVRRSSNPPGSVATNSSANLRNSGSDAVRFRITPPTPSAASESMKLAKIGITCVEILRCRSPRKTNPSCTRSATGWSWPSAPTSVRIDDTGRSTAVFAPPCDRTVRKSTLSCETSCVPSRCNC